MESPKYKVSVRLMAYQHEAYIRQAMSSVLMQQTTFPVEVVVGDDFSKDRTLDIIREFSSTPMIHIRVLNRTPGDEYETNRRLKGRLYNFADIVLNCRGEYVALLDGDDFWQDPLKLQKQVEFLEAHREFAGCYHAVSVVDNDGKEIRSSKNSFVHSRDISGDELIRGRVMSTLSLCFRNVIREFPDEFYKSPTGDNFLCSLLGHFGGGKYLQGIIPSAYRMHGAGTWSLKDAETKRMTLVLSFFWLWQYYNRIGMKEYAVIFYRRIMWEGYYSDPFKGILPDYLGKPEYFLTQFIRKFFRLVRFFVWRPKPPSKFEDEMRLSSRD